jgi:hypothetical protein
MPRAAKEESGGQTPWAAGVARWEAGGRRLEVHRRAGPGEAEAAAAEREPAEPEGREALCRPTRAFRRAAVAPAIARRRAPWARILSKWFAAPVPNRTPCAGEDIAACRAEAVVLSEPVELAQRADAALVASVATSAPVGPAAAAGTARSRRAPKARCVTAVALVPRSSQSNASRIPAPRQRSPVLAPNRPCRCAVSSAW